MTDKQRYVQATIHVIVTESPMEENFANPGTLAPSTTTYTFMEHRYQVSTIEDVTDESAAEIALEEALSQAMARRQGNVGDSG